MKVTLFKNNEVEVNYKNIGFKAKGELATVISVCAVFALIVVGISSLRS